MFSIHTGTVFVKFQSYMMLNAKISYSKSYFNVSSKQFEVVLVKKINTYY